MTATEESGPATPVSAGHFSFTEVSKYSFGSFIQGSSNKLAYGAAIAVAQKAAGSYNPLFIHGETGLGKTHLLFAIGNEVRVRDKAANVAYWPTEMLLAEMISSLRSNKMDQFRCRLKKVDVLLVDDVQCLAGKERTQEELLHVLDYLYHTDKQIILTSDRPPNLVTGLAPRLCGRFECGLLVEIGAADHATKLAYIREKTETLLIPLPEQVLHLLAAQYRNFREINGAVTKLSALSSLLCNDCNSDNRL